MPKHGSIKSITDLKGFGDSYVQQGDDIFVQQENANFFYTLTPPAAADDVNVAKALRLPGSWVKHGTTNTSTGLLSIGNKASGGSIGTAATTVDIASAISIAQTTSGQTLTVPNPTQTAAAHQVAIMNTGTQSFTMLGKTVAAGAGIIIEWNGSAWFAV